MFVVLHSLIDNEISELELEILILAHSLWMGMILAYWPLAKEAAILHLPLTIGVFLVGWNYVPIWSLVLDFAIMVYGRVKFWTDIYPNIIVDAEYERDMARFRDFIVPGNADGADGEIEPARILIYVVNVEVYAAGFATSAAVLVVSVGAAAVGVVGVRTRNEPKVARFGYLHAFACLNALLILLWTAALGETAANLVRNRGPAPELFSSTYHDLVFDATFLFGHAVVARATAQLLAAIRDLNALDGPDGQGYHLQGDADAYQHDDGETLTHL
jgi:hypothetical protein